MINALKTCMNYTSGFKALLWSTRKIRKIVPAGSLFCSLFWRHYICIEKPVKWQRITPVNLNKMKFRRGVFYQHFPILKKSASYHFSVPDRNDWKYREFPTNPDKSHSLKTLHKGVELNKTKSQKNSAQTFTLPDLWNKNQQVPSRSMLRVNARRSNNGKNFCQQPHPLREIYAISIISHPK